MSWNVAVFDASGVLRAERPADVTAPTVPANLRYLARTDSSITLAWDASTDPQGSPGEAVSGVATYTLYRNGTPLITQGGTNYVDSGLLPNTLYNYQVLATDNAGNSSTLSGVVSISTTGEPQPPPPVWDPPSIPLEVTEAANTVTFNKATGTWRQAVTALTQTTYNLANSSAKRGTIVVEVGTHNLVPGTSPNWVDFVGLSGWDYLRVIGASSSNRPKMKMSETAPFTLFPFGKSNLTLHIENLLLEGSRITFGGGYYSGQCNLLLENVDVYACQSYGLFSSFEFTAALPPTVSSSNAVLNRGQFTPYDINRYSPVDDKIYIRNSNIHHNNVVSHNMYVDRIAKFVAINSNWYAGAQHSLGHTFKCEARELYLENCRISNVNLDGTWDTTSYPWLSPQGGIWCNGVPVSILSAQTGYIKDCTVIKAWPTQFPNNEPMGSVFIARQGRHGTHGAEVPDPKAFYEPSPQNDFYNPAYWQGQQGSYAFEMVCENNHFIVPSVGNLAACAQFALYQDAGTWPTENTLYGGTGLSFGNLAGDGPMDVEFYGWFERSRLTCSGDTLEGFAGVVNATGLALYRCATYALPLAGNQNDINFLTAKGRNTMNPTDDNSGVAAAGSRFNVLTLPINV